MEKYIIHCLYIHNPDYFLTYVFYCSHVGFVPRLNLYHEVVFHVLVLKKQNRKQIQSEGNASVLAIIRRIVPHADQRRSSQHGGLAKHHEWRVATDTLKAHSLIQLAKQTLDSKCSGDVASLSSDPF